MVSSPLVLLEQGGEKFNCRQRRVGGAKVRLRRAHSPFDLSQSDEFEGIALALDMAGIVVAADHQHRGLGEP